MKYCTQCKRRGKESDLSCARCGKAFRTLGVSASQTAPKERNEIPSKDREAPAKKHEAKLNLEGLRHRVTQSARRVKWLRNIAVAMLLLFGTMLLYLRYNYVMQFAEVTDVSVQRSLSQSDAVSVVYRPMSSGRIEFLRSSHNRIETMVDHAPQNISGTEAREFRWSDTDRGTVNVEVRHRKGWRIVTETASIAIDSDDS